MAERPPPPRTWGSIPRLPPPPIPRARGVPPPPSTAPRAKLTATRRMLLAASTAVRLREEQVRAQVQYYKADLATNAELDAITHQVVQEFKALSTCDVQARSSQEVEIELIHNLRELLEKLFSKKKHSTFLPRKIEEVQRRIAQLFFGSELYAHLAADGKDVPAASWPEQALYLAIKRHEAAILAELEAIPVSDPAVREQAAERFEDWQRRLSSEFLAKTTPELQRLLTIYRDVLTHFFQEVFPRELGEFCWEVIRESRVAHGHDFGYRIGAERFHVFREVFDRKFLERLVLSVQEPIARTASQHGGQFRDATIRFVQEPRIYSEICAVINDALYDYLHGEGFLDLPSDWRRLLRRR
jgi:hypothetical protein